MNKISVWQSEDRFYWRVAFACCDARPLRFHDWTLAMQAATTHQHHDSSVSLRDPAFFPFDALDLYVVLTAGTNSSPSNTAEKLEANR